MRGVKGLVGICTGAIAALALGLVGAPVASAGQGLILRTANGPLAAGATLTATSTDAVLSTSGGGSAECEESVWGGTLTNNGVKADNFSITSASFSGDYENVMGACKFSLGGPVLTEAKSLPWRLELSSKAAAIPGSLRLAVSFPDTMPELTCVYESRKLLGSVTTAPQLMASFNDAPSVRVEGPPESCPANGALTATFAFTSSGKPVEGVIGNEEPSEAPASLSGTVSNEAAEGVEGVTVEACEEEGEQAETCQSTQSGPGGHYAFATLPTGFYELVAKPRALSGYAPARSEEFEALSGESVTENIVVPGAGSVHGEISSESSVPLAGVKVSLCEQVKPRCLTTTTESAGGYSFAEVAVGSYTITASPAAGSGYGREDSTAFAVTGGHATTENLELPEAGSVTGVVTNQQSSPLAGEIVDVCLHEVCYQGETGSFGSYTIEGVGVGSGYVATVAASGAYGSAISGAFNVVGTGSSTVNLTVGEPVAPRAGTEMPSSGLIAVGNVQVPLFYWNNEAALKTTGCVGGHVTATATGINTQTFLLETSHPVTLAEAPASSGKFEGLLPKLYPVHGFLTITIKIEGCTQPSEEETTEFNAYVDPSGTVLDGNHGDATVSGATVTLLSGPESFGPFTAVTNGSTVMSPANRKNPDTTGSHGEFGWDTLPGYYQVEAHKSGCGSTRTPSFRVPPPVDNLQLVLHCEPVLIETSSLPAAKREVHYETQLVAGGEHPPFKWKKKGTLPKGLKLSKTGVLSGTIKRKKVHLGTYAVEVEVKDAARHTATVTLPLKVR
jgi:Carboxypeptidase regulatory-like domain/Putative Ig domain